MVLCKYSLEGQDCPMFQKCPDDHLDIKQFIKTEMETAINGDQWPLSSFGPFTEKPSIPNYIEDQSFEEIRLLYYGSDYQNFFESCQQFTKAITEAKTKMKMLLSVNKEVMDMLIKLYNFDEPPKKSIINFPVALRTAGNMQQSTSSSFGGTSSETSSVSSFASINSSGIQLFNAPKKFAFGPTTFSFAKQQGTSASFFNPIPSFQQQGQQSLGFFGSKELQKLQTSAFSDIPTAHPPALAEEEHNKVKDYLEEISAKMDSILDQINENKMAISTQEKEMNSIVDFIKKMTVAEKQAKKIEPKKEPETKKANTRTSTVPPLLIKPKQKQTSEKTKADIKCRIDPLNLSIRVLNITNAARGAILVKCKNKESIQKLKAEVKEKCSDSYDIQDVRLANPKIMVNGIDNEIEEDDLIRIIKKQNEITGSMTLIRCYEKNDRMYNALIEVTKDVYNTLMEDNEPYLNIGWTRCFVNDNIRVRRCFNCWGFNHNAKQCRNDTRCPKCGGQHIDKNCSSPRLRCSNCTKANIRLNLKLDARHDSRNYNCHVYLSKLQKERDLIDY